MKTKEYQFLIRGCSSIKDVQEYIAEINGCEFCNKGAFHLKLRNIPVKQEDFCTAIIEVKFKKIFDKRSFRKIADCPNCHGDRDVLILKG